MRELLSPQNMDVFKAAWRAANIEGYNDNEMQSLIYSRLMEGDI